MDGYPGPSEYPICRGLATTRKSPKAIVRLRCQGGSVAAEPQSQKDGRGGPGLTNPGAWCVALHLSRLLALQPGHPTSRPSSEIDLHFLGPCDQARAKVNHGADRVFVAPARSPFSSPEERTVDQGPGEHPSFDFGYDEIDEGPV